MYYFNYLGPFNENNGLNHFSDFGEKEYISGFHNRGCNFLLNYYKNKSAIECIEIFKKLIEELQTKYDHPTTNSPTYYGMPPEMLPLYFFELVFEEILSRDISTEIKNEIIYLKIELYYVAFYSNEMKLYNLEYDKNIFQDLTFNLFPLNYPRINEQIYTLLSQYSGLLVNRLVKGCNEVTRINVDFYIKKREYLKTMLRYLFPEECDELFQEIDYHLNEFLHDMISKFTIDDLKKHENIKNLELIIVLTELSLYEDDLYYEFKDGLFEKIVDKAKKEYADFDNPYDFISTGNYFEHMPIPEIVNIISDKLSKYLKIFSEHTIKDPKFVYYYTIYKSQKYKQIIFYFEKMRLVNFYGHSQINDIEKFYYITKIDFSKSSDVVDDDFYYYDYLYWTEPLGGYPSEYKNKKEKTNKHYYEYEEDEYYYNPDYDSTEHYIKEAFDGDEDDFENYYEGIIDRYD